MPFPVGLTISLELLLLCLVTSASPLSYYRSRRVCVQRQRLQVSSLRPGAREPPDVVSTRTRRNGPDKGRRSKGVRLEDLDRYNQGSCEDSRKTMFRDTTNADEAGTNVQTGVTLTVAAVFQIQFIRARSTPNTRIEQLWESVQPPSGDSEPHVEEQTQPHEGASSDSTQP
ncbi:hypothetical protein BDZ89DRAFT_1236832 [Hymenopellis radicata]|nr:hypothetical protein BDZ89DRAFT_1236832 [Hymenopellis radicata]